VITIANKITAVKIFLFFVVIVLFEALPVLTQAMPLLTLNVNPKRVQLAQSQAVFPMCDKERVTVMSIPNCAC
jgi:hypothetical protein